jgi:hypothetical protein
MDKSVLDTIGNIYCLIIGLICAVFYKWCARGAARFYSKLFRKDYDEKIYQPFFLLGGMIFILLSLLSLFGITRSK